MDKLYMIFAMIVHFAFGTGTVREMQASACNEANITLYCRVGFLDIYQAFLVADVGPGDRCAYNPVDCQFDKSDLPIGTTFFEHVESCQRRMSCTLTVSQEILFSTKTCAHGNTKTSYGLVNYRCSDAETTTGFPAGHTTKETDPVVIALSVVAAVAVTVAVVVIIIFCLKRRSTAEKSQKPMTSPTFANRTYAEADIITENRPCPREPTDPSTSATCRVQDNNPPLDDATYSTIDESVVLCLSSGIVDPHRESSVCTRDPDGYDVMPCDRSSLPLVSECDMPENNKGGSEDKTEMESGQGSVSTDSTHSDVDDVGIKNKGGLSLLGDRNSRKCAGYNESDTTFIVDNEKYEPFELAGVAEDGTLSDSLENKNDEKPAGAPTKCNEFETVIIDNVAYAGTIQQD